MTFVHQSRNETSNDNRVSDLQRLRAAVARLDRNTKKQRQSIAEFRHVMSELRDAVDDLQGDMKTYRASLIDLNSKTGDLGKTLRAFPA